jgi:hypothetical protein
MGYSLIMNVVIFKYGITITSKNGGILLAGKRSECHAENSADGQTPFFAMDQRV